MLSLPVGVERAARPARGRLGEQVYEQLKNGLLDGDFKMGQRLPLDELVTWLEQGDPPIKTSRQPVMESLKRLEFEGLIEIIPQVGCRVVAHAAQEIADFFRIVAASEGIMAEFAAQRRSEDELAVLEAYSTRIGRLPTAKIKPEQAAHDYRLLNRAFHGQIHRMAHSLTLARFAENFWDRADFYISTALGTHLFADRLGDAHAEHEQVRLAIEKGNAATARRTMENHILAFASNIDLVNKQHRK